MKNIKKMDENTRFGLGLLGIGVTVLGLLTYPVWVEYIPYLNQNVYQAKVVDVSKPSIHSYYIDTILEDGEERRFEERWNLGNDMFHPVDAMRLVPGREYCFKTKGWKLTLEKIINYKDLEPGEICNEYTIFPERPTAFDSSFSE